MVQLQIWVIVENNTVCLAASIPALRPLLRKRQAGSSSATTVRGEYSSWNKGLSSKRHTQDLRNMQKSMQHHNGDSEEYILSSVNETPADQITKTTAVSVAYENGDGRNETSRAVDGMPGFLKESKAGPNMT